MSTTDNNTLIERLFSAGAHFGFKKSRRHPTVTKYLFTTKEGNDIFDLEKTSVLLENAKEVMKQAGQNGKTVLLVGTKDEVTKLVTDAATKIGAPYVTNRWVGGMLTNFSEIKKRINRLEALGHEKESGELDRKYTKKERVIIGREVDKLNYNFKGISTIQRNPDVMVVVDPRHDHIAVTEAIESKVPVIAIMSSDCNTSVATYPVIANDALQSSVSFLLNELTAAYAEGKTAFVPREVKKEVLPRRRTA